MLSIIEVKCPHCGTRGKLMLPPVGAIIVGPCPECQGLVVVFAGRILPLDNQVMLEGSMDEKRQHLMSVLTSFLEKRVVELLENAGAPGHEEESEMGAEDEVAADTNEEAADPSSKAPERGIISQAELDHFVEVDLKLLDNKEYFEAVFKS